MSDEPFVKVQVELLYSAEALGLNDHTVRLVLAVMSFDWRRGRPVYPTQAQIAERCGCDERGVRERWKKLDALDPKLITRKRSRARGGYVYELSPLRARLDELAADRRVVAALAAGADRREVAGLDDSDRRVVAAYVDTGTTKTQEEDTHTACARDLPRQVLEEFNRAAQHSYAAPKWLAMVEARCREHPDLDLAEHAAVIVRNFATPWWGDSPSPAVLYTDAAGFEKALRATGRPRLSPKAQDLEDRTRERLAKIEAYERAKRADVIEGTAVEIPNDGEVDLDVDGLGDQRRGHQGEGDDGEPDSWKPTATDLHCLNLGRRS